MSFPFSEVDLVIWLNQFSKVFQLHASRLGFRELDVVTVANDAAMLSFLIEVELPTYSAALSERREYKNLIKDGCLDTPRKSFPRTPATPVLPELVEPGIVPRLQELIRKITTSPAYSDDIGKELGLIGWQNKLVCNSAPAKPDGRAIGQRDNEVRVEFSKSAFDGVLIESRRTGQTDWSALCKDSVSPYVDSRPLVRSGKPEVREYRMRFLLRDEPIGEWSDILVATASY